MTPREFVESARRQPELLIERVVQVPGPQLVALLGSGKPLLVSELVAHPDQHSENRRFRYGHVVEGGLPDAAISRWQQLHPQSALSADLADLLRDMNGIHLWADLDRGRAYFGILPLAEWRQVREHEAALLFQHLPPRTLVISYHDNGDYFLLLDPVRNRFTWFDPQSPDDSTPAGDSVEDFLAWWWQYARQLDPRHDTEPRRRCRRTRRLSFATETPANKAF